MSITWSGISAARQRLARLSVGLREAAGGEVLARAVARVAEQVEAVVSSTLARHELSGAAAAATVTTTSGALVQVHEMPPAHGQRWTGRSYVSLQRAWRWPFRSGMPPFVVKRASIIFARELLLALGARAGEDALSLAADVATADEAEAQASAKTAAKFKRDIGRIYRQSAEGKAARREARRAARG